MKYILFNTILFCSILGLSQSPNDCLNYIQVCGNYNIQLNVSGSGVQEINANNACSSQENNSLWLHFTVEESGFLSFDIIPQSTDLQEDYDFWIFGPNATCNNLGQSIRCSTTNPVNAGLSHNKTGISEYAHDTYEGPGADGDSFVEWLDVTAGESYFLVIDRPIGNSSFELIWGGTALLSNPLEDYEIYNADPLYLCDSDDDGVESFDLSTIENQWIDNLTGITITYHLTSSDAFTGNNPLPQIADLETRIYYVRIENTGSKCFEIKNWRVDVSGLGLSPIEIKLCDENEDQQEVYDLSQIEISTNSISFHPSIIDAYNDTNPIIPGNIVITSDTTLYLRVTNEDNCVDFTTLKLSLLQIPNVESQSDSICLNEINNGMVQLSDYAYLFEEQPQFSVFFYSSAENRENNVPVNGTHPLQMGDNQIFVRIFNDICYQDNMFTLTLLNIPELGENENIKICPEQFPFTLPHVVSGYSRYVWNTQEEGVTTISINDIGEYTVTVTNDVGCEETKTYAVSYHDIPFITQLLVENENQITAFTNENTLNTWFSLDDGTWQESPVFQNVESGIHQIRVKLENGCISEPKFTYVLKINNFLTPNNDGMNDTWIFPGLENFEGSTIEIFDRYGKLIYQENGGKPFVWDGKYLGQSLPTADYWYIISLPDGRKHVGHITIKN